MKQNQSPFFPGMILSLFMSVMMCADGVSKTMEYKEHMLIDFSKPVEIKNWRTINDGVMGGIPKSTLRFQDTGTMVFEGEVSLENNGGFASTRTIPRNFELDGYTGLLIRVKGDGKDYQIRLRTDDRFDGVSYRYPFTTKPGSWSVERIPFSEFIPVYHGRIQYNALPVSPIEVQQIGFLIGDKQSGEFRLEVESIQAYR